MERLGGAGVREVRAEREGASQRSVTESARSARAMEGQSVGRMLSCRRSVSAALHAAG